jgi:drug/metabolite transporter (DMT)-like permease
MKLASPEFVVSHRTVRTAYLLMLASSLAFAAMAACGHAVGHEMDWRLVAIARASIVLAFTIPLAKASGVQLIRRWPRTLWVRSITGSISMLLTFFALIHTEQISTTLTFTNTFPLWVTVLAWPMLAERPTLGVCIALLSGVAGVVLIEHPQTGEIRWASLAALGAAFCTAVVMIGLNRLRNLDSLLIVVHFSAVATIICTGYTVLTALHGQDLPLKSLTSGWNWLLLIGMGTLATAGQIFMTIAFRSAPPQKLSLIALSQVVFALGFDLGIWHHEIGLTTYAGIALVLIPVAWLVGGRALRLRKRAKIVEPESFVDPPSAVM